MAYLAVDESGDELIFENSPSRRYSVYPPNRGWWESWDEEQTEEYFPVRLPSGTIERLTGKNMSWEDEPFKFIEIGGFNG